MRTKLLVAVIPVGVAALSLTGCGDNTSAQVNADIQRLAVVYDMKQTSGTDLPEADRVYSMPHTIDGIPVAADHSDAAARQDELNAMLTELEAAHNNAAASPRQKATVARMMAEIQYGNAKYLGNVAAASYVPLRSSATQLQPFADRIDSIQGVITIYEGDRDIIVQTLQSGSDEGALQVSGIDQLRERAEAIQALIDESSDASETYSGQADQYSDTVLEYEQLELELRTQARTLSGDAQFDLLDQAVRAKLEARMAGIEAEYNALLAEAQAANTTRHGDNLEQVESVIEGLRARIAAVREEIEAYATEVRGAKNEQGDAIDDLVNAYRDLDTQIEALVFSRLEDATESAAQAVELYRGRSAAGVRDSAGTTDTLNALTMQLQLMYQHAVSLSGYKSALETLAANGDTVLGADLANSLSSRIGTLDTQIQGLKDAAGELLAEADELTNTLPAAGPDETDNPKSGLESQLDTVRSGMGDLPYSVETQ